MSILVVGSVAYDSVITPAGRREDSLGGSATYFSVSAGRFSQVHLVAVVGEDFKEDHLTLLRHHQLDLSGLTTLPGKTFRWSAEYHMDDLNRRTTLDTQLNVFVDFQPDLDSNHRQQPYLFLANIDPELQLNVLEQMEERPKLVAIDTMNLWIDSKPEALAEVIKRVDVVFMDETEVRMFAGPHIAGNSVLKAAHYLLSLGPRMAVIKRGEHGVVQFTRDSVFAAPAFPVESVVDPTGAGDSFAGGFMGYLAYSNDLSDRGFRRASILGSVMGSFAVEDFSVDRLHKLNRAETTARFRALSDMTRFDSLEETEVLAWREGVIFG